LAFAKEQLVEAVTLVGLVVVKTMDLESKQAEIWNQ